MTTARTEFLLALHSPVRIDWTAGRYLLLGLAAVWAVALFLSR